MRYTNPVLKGFYPDPSVCAANGKFYLVCSSFQYFPGVPLFESEDLVNWNQVGHVLTRKSQVQLDQVESSGGVFAATIRYHAGRFYMVTTNNTTHQNFYVYTDDIYGEWSEPIYVDQGGIDPSLYFEDDRVYFMSNGADAKGISGIVQCEIELETGRKLTESRTIWQGSGGRFLESPHMYRIGAYYYLMAAEGGTEYGHMITCARSDSVWGPFEANPANPILTNRNKAPYRIQGIGHGDLIQDAQGNWYILSLGFRQQGMWAAFHHLGRETFLTPVQFHEDGWFTAGTDGTVDETYEMPGDFEQRIKREETFQNTDWNKDWIYLRHPKESQYTLMEDGLILRGTDVTLQEAASPTFIGIRQKEFCMECSVTVSLDGGTAGITVYMSESEHYDLAVEQNESGVFAVLRLNLGGICHEAGRLRLSGNMAKLCIRSDAYQYSFFVSEPDSEDQNYLGQGLSKFLSSEISSPFTGVICGLYAEHAGAAKFSNFRCIYTDEA